MTKRRNDPPSWFMPVVLAAAGAVAALLAWLLAYLE